MKKFLEVLVDEDGKFHFSTEEVFTTEEEFAAEDRPGQMTCMQEYDNLLRRLIHDMTEFMWKTKDQQVSQAVRSLAMAEIIGCADPYDRAEEFWSLMMFHTIPQFEHYAAAIKKRHGFDDSNVNRPYIGGTLPDGTLVGGPAGGPMKAIDRMEALRELRELGEFDDLDDLDTADSLAPIDGADHFSFPIPQPAGKVLS